jgi:hypothetical protein
MPHYLIANPPPQVFYSHLAIGILAVSAIIAVFVRKRPGFGWRNLLRLCIIMLLAGPLAGAWAACIAIVFGAVCPQDRWWLASVLTELGAIAGLIAVAITGVVGVVRLLEYGARQKSRLAQAARGVPETDERERSE